MQRKIWYIASYKINCFLGLFWFLQVHFVAIVENNIEKKAIFLSITFESGNIWNESESDPKYNKFDKVKE